MTVPSFSKRNKKTEKAFIIITIPLIDNISLFIKQWNTVDY